MNTLQALWITQISKKKHLIIPKLWIAPDLKTKPVWLVSKLPWVFIVVMLSAKIIRLSDDMIQTESSTSLVYNLFF